MFSRSYGFQWGVCAPQRIIIPFSICKLQRLKSFGTDAVKKKKKKTTESLTLSVFRQWHHNLWPNTRYDFTNRISIYVLCVFAF